ncbi:hypothetical protein HJD18_10440 [Thermoleophilia bacterium SCSIO 60948]|nr:hypothetical protein HJD18_10440 [Thermoleophilia bacterium SCSIO 60948]
MSEKQEVTAKQLAERLEVDPKALRKWLRSEGLGLGERGQRNGRYSFTPQKAGQLAKRFKAQQEKEAADAS